MKPAFPCFAHCQLDFGINGFVYDVCSRSWSRVEHCVATCHKKAALKPSTVTFLLAAGYILYDRLSMSVKFVKTYYGEIIHTLDSYHFKTLEKTMTGISFNDMLMAYDTDSSMR